MFTFCNWLCYNMVVKKYIALFTICALTLCTGSYLTASADSGVTIPENFSVEFTLDSVEDYAVTDGYFAFASGRNIYIYSVNESSASAAGYDYMDGTLETYSHTSSVLGLEYINGQLYFRDNSSSYIYIDGATTAIDVSFTSYDDSQVKYDYTNDGYYLYSIVDGVLYLIKIPEYNYLNDATYCKLKKIDDTYYVLKDSTLCMLSKGVLSELSFSYEDYEIVDDISTGDIATQLKSTTSSIKLAKITAGACLIRVDEDNLSGSYFTTKGITFADGSENAQVLYMSSGGNSALIAVGTRAYLTLKSNITTSDYILSTVSTSYASLLDDVGVYSSPFECDTTRITTLQANTIVTVLGYASNGAFDNSYYKIEYTDGGKTVSGFVVSGLLTSYTFDNDDSDGELVQNELEEGNNILTIILVLIIVLLVLIAAGYITFVATADRRRRPRRK